MSAEAARLYISVGADVRGAQGNLRSLDRSLHSSAANAIKTAAAFAGIGTAAAVLQGITSVTVGFDKSMRNVNSIAHLNEQQFKKLSKSVRELGGKTAQSPRTLADGLYDLVSSGFDAKESLLILRSSAKAATAGLTDTATSTKAVAAVLNAYHRPASDAAKVSDDLFQTVNRGVLSFQDLAQNIGDVLPFASALHVGLKQVGAATATMTKAGVSAPETMTRIKSVMSQLIKPSDDLKTAYQKLGVASGEELVRKTGSLQSAIVALSGSVGGNKEKLAKLFPDIRALGGALLLSGSNARTAANDLRAFAGDAGVTNRTLAEQSKSISYQWNRIKAQVESAAIALGTKLIPAASSALDWISKTVGQFQTGRGAAGDFAKDVTSAFDKIKASVSSNMSTIKATIADIKDIGKTVAGALQGLHFDLGGMLDSMFSGAVQRIHGIVRTIKSALHGDFKGMLSGIGDTLAGQMTMALAPFTALAQALPKPFRSAVTTILGLFSSVLSGAASMAETMAGIPVVGKAFKGMADGIKSAAAEIDRLRDKINGVGGKKPLKIDVNADHALAMLKDINGTKIGKKIMKVLGDKKDADGKIKELIALGIPAKKAKVLAEVAAALAGIKSVSQALALIPLRKSVSIDIQQHGTTNFPALTNGPNGTGGPADSTPRSGPKTGGGPKGHSSSVGPVASASRAKKAPAPVEDENPINGEIETHAPAEWKRIRLKYKHSRTLQRKAKARKKAAERKFQGGFDRFDQLMSDRGVDVAQAGLTDTPTDDIAALQASDKSRQRRIATLRKMLKDKRLKGKHRQQANDQLAGLLGDSASSASQIKDLGAPKFTGGDYANAGIAVAATTPGLGDDVTAASDAVKVFTADLDAAKATGDPTKIADAANNLTNASGQLATATEALKAAAEAARDTQFTADDAATVMAKVLTPDDLSDDLKSLNVSLDDATKYFNEAMAAGDTAGIIKWGNAILGLRDELKSNTEALNSNTEALNAQLELTQQLLDVANTKSSTGQAELRAFGKYVVGIVSGEIGSTVGRGLSTPRPLALSSR